MKALDALFADSNRGDAPGLVVGIAQRGHVLYRRGFGLASVEHGVVNTPRTRMRLASVTKHMTCLALLLLAEEGKLDIDDPATKLLPELPPLQGVPTLRQLMTHTGGYHCNLELIYLASGLASQPRGASLALQFAQTGASFAPGTSQLYCNGGYTLLSEAIARASGTSFEAFMKTRLFEPLGMKDTEAVPSDLQIVPGLASFHLPMPDGGWRRGISPLDDNRGEGSVVTTVDDMLTWLAHLRAPAKRVGSDASWRQMTTTATLDDGRATPYALGLNVHRWRGLDVIHHGGSLIGAASQMLTVPEHELDIIVMTNGGTANPVQLAWDAVELLLREHLIGTTPELVKSERFGHLFGRRYHAESGMVVGFGDAGGLLGVSLLGSPPIPFLRDRGEVLSVRFEEAGLGPIEIRVADLGPAADGGAPAELPIAEAGAVERFVRLPKTPPPLAEVGQPLVGRYRIADLQADGRIAFESAKLVMRWQSPQAQRTGEIDAYGDDVFGLRLVDPMAPAFPAFVVERERGQVRGLWLSSGRARRIWVERIGDLDAPAV